MKSTTSSYVLPLKRIAPAIALLTWSALGVAPAVGQGADDCENAEVIFGDGVYVFDNAGTTTDGIGCEDETFMADVWWAWTADASGTVTVDTCGQTSVDTILAAYDDAPCPPEPAIACNDDDNCEYQSRISWAAVAGETYLIRLGSYNGEIGTGTITIQSSAGACCMADGSCERLESDECDTLGGTFLGQATTCTGSVCVESGAAFTYQGQLVMDGGLLTGTADFEFTLWDDMTGGNRVGGFDAIDDVPVVDGVFSVSLNADNEFGADAFIGAARWLEIAVRSPSGVGDFTLLLPRQRLTTAPLAAYAEHTRGITINDDGVTVESELRVDRGNAISGVASVVTLSGARTAAGNQYAGINFQNFDNDGNLGADYLGARIRSHNAEGVDSGDLRFFTRASTDGNPQERMRITSDGNVGVGTTSPDTALDVNGIAKASVFVGDGSGLANLRGVWTESGSNLYYDAGNVGIGRVPAVNALEVEGEASKTFPGVWAANCDRRIKQNIVTIAGALDVLDRVRLVSYAYTEDYRAAHPSVGSRRHLSVIAQEFAEVFPDYVRGSGEFLPSGSEILQVDAWPLTIYSAAAIQELRAQKDAEIAELRSEKNAEIADLQERMARLESFVRQPDSHGQRVD